MYQEPSPPENVSRRPSREVGRFDAEPEDGRWIRTIGLLVLYDIGVLLLIAIAVVAVASIGEGILEIEAVQAALTWIDQAWQSITAWFEQ